MGFRDRAAGHAILEEADFTKLADLPKPVAFQVRLFQKKKLKVWFVGTRSNVKKWDKNDDPFAEFTPDGSPKFVKLALEAAAPFCKAFDELHAFAKVAFPKSQYIGFGPSKNIGELSLGLQIATLLGTRVFSFIDDDDPDEAILACVCHAGQVERARCEKAGMHIVFENGAATVCQITNTGNMHAPQVVHPDGFALIDTGPLLVRLASISGVTKGKQPKDYFGWSKQLVSQELNAFVGAEIAEPETVVPSFSSMKLLAQRTAGGKVKLF